MPKIKNEIQVPNTAIDKIRRLSSHEQWCKWAFPLLENRQFELANHHRILCNVIDQVLLGKIKRLIINMPPGHGKTELTTIMLTARILAANSKARLMHLSFSDALVRKNSRRIRKLIKNESFNQEYPDLKISKESSAQGHWETTEGGEFHAVSTGGEVTGFRAGWDGNPWDGGIILDDMMKPKDARSLTVRTSVNELLNDTVSSRLAHDNTWIISIQQRLHLDDTSAYLMRGGAGEEWHVLVLPAINEGKPPEHYRKYSHARLIEYDTNDVPPGALWEGRYGLKRLHAIQNARDTEADEDMPKGKLAFASQYQQSPLDSSITLFDTEWINWYKEPPELLENGFIRIDTASTDNKKNDFTACLTFGSDSRYPQYLYAVDGVRMREAPMRMFRAVADYIERNVSLTGQRWRIHVVRIENANIGPALASFLEGELALRGIAIRVELLKGDVYKKNKKTKKVERIASNKFQRAELVLPDVEQGRLYLPLCPTKYTDGQFAPILKNEISLFTLDDRHDTDDLFDCAALGLIDQFHKVNTSHGYKGFAQIDET